MQLLHSNWFKRKKDLDVLFCYESYDELVLMQLQEFDKKKVTSVEKEMRQVRRIFELEQLKPFKSNNLLNWSILKSKDAFHSQLYDRKALIIWSLLFIPLEFKSNANNQTGQLKVFYVYREARRQLRRKALCPLLSSVNSGKTIIKIKVTFFFNRFCFYLSYFWFLVIVSEVL